MKLDFVVPRYGAEVAGGAESAVRMLAERLVSSLGWDVGVLTTCARDARTWADVCEPGETVEGGVRVQRFRSLAGRHPRFDAFCTPVLYGNATPPPADQQKWVEMQGPVNPELVKAAVSSEADLVVFSPYLYYPTVHGAPLVGDRAVVHPAAHEEAALGLSVMRDVFTSVGGLVFYTHGERRMVARKFSVGHVPQIVLGLGVELPEGGLDPAGARAALGLGPDEPYLLCVGRVDEGKGTGMLAKSFAAYKRRRPGPLKLVLAGQVVDRPARHPDIVVPGLVDEAVKWGAYAGATALVQPSPHESFSLVLIEAWLAGAPALVNLACAATWEHVSRSGGGLGFASYVEFEVAVDRLVGDESLRAALAAKGRSYAEAEFSWPVLVDRYARFMTSCALRVRR